MNLQDRLEIRRATNCINQCVELEAFDVALAFVEALRVRLIQASDPDTVSHFKKSAEAIIERGFA